MGRSKRNVRSLSLSWTRLTGSGMAHGPPGGNVNNMLTLAALCLRPSITHSTLSTFQILSNADEHGGESVEHLFMKRLHTVPLILFAFQFRVSCHPAMYRTPDVGMSNSRVSMLLDFHLGLVMISSFKIQRFNTDLIKFWRVVRGCQCGVQFHIE
ncbi:hypothetical protein EV421DRAFT_742877 [Armillaria borealis]|uniref:Uncharacterized protein n=1 Tax=Armillaria borealis TaxID=47425 RepID=A0AA39MPA2_9AGAR|nr:hypothetical protein EV421DRAFT_742877 [Armillaria borealis]